MDKEGTRRKLAKMLVNYEKDGTIVIPKIIDFDISGVAHFGVFGLPDSKTTAVTNGKGPKEFRLDNNKFV